MSLSRFSVDKLASKLKEIRSTERRLDGIVTEPICTCEPISAGCKCGRIEWERMMRDRVGQEAPQRCWPITPIAGEVYLISRPPETDINYCSVPFRVWAKCEGRKVEIIQTQQDENQPDWWWCYCDVSHITKDPNDHHWFPNDGLLEIRNE